MLNGIPAITPLSQYAICVSPDYSASMRKTRFRQRSRIAYNAPVFAGLIDCTGPVLLLVAVAGQMCPAGTFTRSANPPNFPFYEIRSINFGISEAAPITDPNSTCGISAACQFDWLPISDFPTLAKGYLQSPFSSRIFYQ